MKFEQHLLLEHLTFVDRDQDRLVGGAIECGDSDCRSGAGRSLLSDEPFLQGFRCVAIGLRCETRVNQTAEEDGMRRVGFC